MIARIRIAPVEQWCEAVKNGMQKQFLRVNCQSLVGSTIEIETTTMIISKRPGCGGRLWRITDSSVKQHEEKIGYTPTQYICEHVAEMD
jgi:hypothetical protein